MLEVLCLESQFRVGSFHKVVHLGELAHGEIVIECLDVRYHQELRLEAEPSTNTENRNVCFKACFDQFDLHTVFF